MKNNPQDPPLLLPGVTIDQLKPITCKSCGNIVFQQGLTLRKASALLTTDGVEKILPFMTFYCTKCGEIYKEENET